MAKDKIELALNFHQSVYNTILKFFKRANYDVNVENGALLYIPVCFSI